MSLLLTLALMQRLAPGADFVPPKTDQPLTFVGGAFEGLDVQLKLDAILPEKTVELGKPFLYVLRVEVLKGTILQPPGRPRLQDDEYFQPDFFVEAPIPAIKQISPRVWDLRYLLKPKRPGIKSVPDVSFVFYTRKSGQDPGGYDEAFVPEKKITVVKPRKPERRLNLNPQVLQFPDSDKLLQRTISWSPPGVQTIVLFLLAPLMGCALWWYVWQRLYPDEARRAQHRHSRAAKRALSMLHRLPRENVYAQAKHVSRALIQYLQERWDLPIQFATSEEAEDHLHKTMIPSELHAPLGDLLREAEEIQFSSRRGSIADLRKSAEQWILDVEDLEV